MSDAEDQITTEKPVVEETRFEAAKPEKPKSKYFNNKRLSRNIVGYITGGVFVAALIAFVLMNGNRNMSQEAKDKKAQADNEAAANSNKFTSQSAQEYARELELQALKEKGDADKKKAALDALNSNTPKVEVSTTADNQDYPKDSLKDKIDAYEQDKLRAQVYGGATTKKERTLAAYESGMSLGGINGDLDLGTVNPVKAMQESVARAEAEDLANREARQRELLGQKPEAKELPANLDSNDAWRASQVQMNQVVNTSEALQPELPPSKFLVHEGSTITAVLETSINSQLPGKIEARVTENVYDTIHGEHLLIPAGSKLIGGYNTDVRGGQDRVFIAFNRVIFRNGSSMQIGSMAGSDPQGMAGISGEVVTNFWKQMGSSFLIAAIGNLVDNSNNSGGTTNNFGATNGGVGSAAGQVLADTAKANLDRYAQFRPYIQVELGEKITIVVAKDMQLNPKIVRDGLSLVK